MSLQDLQTVLLNIIMNGRVDPNNTSVVFKDSTTRNTVAVTNVSVDYENGETVIILKSE